MRVYIARDVTAFIMYCVNGESGSSLLIESTDSMIKFWLRFATNWDISSLLKEAYLLLSSFPSAKSLLSQIKNLLDQALATCG